MEAVLSSKTFAPTYKSAWHYNQETIIEVFAAIGTSNGIL
jgi:hypothetical protein